MKQLTPFYSKIKPQGRPICLQKLDVVVSGMGSLSQIPKWHNVTEVNTTGNAVSITAPGRAVQHQQTRTKGLQQAAGQLQMGW